jgi:DNA-nicking Smr family endonuclease
VRDGTGFLAYYCISITAFMTHLQLDLHHIYNSNRAVEDALQQLFDEAIAKKIREVQIIPGKESGRLVKKIELFLQQPHIKKHYQRMEKGDKKKGSLIVYFKF